MPRPIRALALSAVASLGVGAAVLISVLSAAGPASAAAGPPAAPFNCRASVAYVSIPSLSALLPQRVEPIFANGTTSYADLDAPSCASDVDQLPSVTLGSIVALLPVAQTTYTPLPANATSTYSSGATPPATAAATAANVQIGLGSGLGALPVPGLPTLPALGSGSLLGLSLLTSSAQFACVDGTPVPSGTSNFGTLTIGGTPIDLDDLANAIASLLSPLDAIVDVKVNQGTTNVDTTNPADPITTFTQRALEIDILSAVGTTPLIQIVVGEAQVSAAASACSGPYPPSSTTTVTNTVTTGSGTSVVYTNGATPPTVTNTVTNAVTTAGPTTTATNTVTNTNTVTTAAAATTPAPTTTIVSPGTTGVLGSHSSSSGKPNGKNGGACGHIHMHWVTDGKSAVTSTFGVRQVVRGTVFNCKGKPIINAKISVVEIEDGHHLVKTGLRSRPAGKLTDILPLNITTRTIEFIYHGLSNSVVTSEAKLRITVLRNGKVLTGPAPAH